MKYSEYLTNIIGRIKRDVAANRPIFICNQIQCCHHPIHTPKLRLFIARLLDKQERETGIHATALSPYAYKHFGLDYEREHITQQQQNEYRLHILQKYLDQVIHLEKIASQRKSKKK